MIAAAEDRHEIGLRAPGKTPRLLRLTASALLHRLPSRYKEELGINSQFVGHYAKLGILY